MSFKAILFDLDDTILNSKTAQLNTLYSFKKMFKVFDNMSEKDFTDLWSQITTELYEIYSKGEISFDMQETEKFKRLFAEVNITIQDNDAKKKLDKYLNLYKDNWILFDDTTKVLEQLKKTYKLAIVSNGESNQQRAKIEKTGLNKYFNKIIISSEVGFAKPKKEIFEITSKKLNVLTSECIMVGDKFKVDIMGAREAGMKAILVNRRNEEIDYKYQVKDLKDILIYIK